MAAKARAPERGHRYMQTGSYPIWMMWRSVVRRKTVPQVGSADQGSTMNELMLGLPRMAGFGFRDEAASTEERQEPSDEELVATLRQAAERGSLAPLRIRDLVARRIERAELALLSVSSKLS